MSIFNWYDVENNIYLRTTIQEGDILIYNGMKFRVESVNDRMHSNFNVTPIGCVDTYKEEKKC